MAGKVCQKHEFHWTFHTIPVFLCKMRRSWWFYSVCNRTVSWINSLIRASTATCQMLNIWHTKHQKIPFMRCSKSHNFCHIWTVSFHFGKVQTRMLKKKKKILFISLSSFLTFSLLSLSFLFSFLCDVVVVFDDILF